MKCCRSGHCCFEYEVIIVDDPALGIVEGNLISKHTGDRCQHVRGDAPGEYSCVIHDEPWYDETPCYAYSQIEQSPDSLCRVGEYILKTSQITP